jgi:RNA polymerase sigma factor (sigma-70 family)
VPPAPGTKSDADLLRACRRGDAAGWEELVHRYQRFVHDIPRRAGLDEQASAEVFQDVFLALIQSLEDIEQPERLSAWILTTAKRATWRMVRRRTAARTGQTSIDEEAEEAPDVQPLPEDVLLRLEEQHAVRTAMADLDERCQRLLKLLFYASKPPAYGDVAARLGIAEGSIGPIRARCLERLHRRFRDVTS